MAEEPDNLILHLLRGIRADIDAIRGDMATNMATKADLAEVRADLKSDMHSLRADVASDLATLEAKMNGEFKSVREQFAGMRRTMLDYHSAVLGHGALISELESRIQRVERHLDLPPFEAH